MSNDRTSGDPARRPLWNGRLNLEQQKKRAKALLRALQAGDPAAAERLRARHPRADRVQPAEARLADAQLVVAREGGFESWPRLKAHAAQLGAARDEIHAARAVLDRECTLHVRCGSDLQRPLCDAGFVGAFHEFCDPFCQGPVRDLPRAALIAERTSFLSRAYGRTHGAARDRLASEYALFDRIEQYEEIVLWFEHDVYDQLILAYLLKELPLTRKARLMLVCVERVPAVQTFFGLGQLAPEVLRLLYAQRTPVDPAQQALGARVWSALTSPSPEALHRLASTATEPLPPMGPALLRHLQELPATRDGLSLTERHSLDLLATSGPMEARALFTRLVHEREAAPFLGDLMYWPILQELATIGILDAPPRGDHHDSWPRRVVSLTALGQAVQAGEVDRVALGCDRWLGGIHLRAGSPCWRWDQAGHGPVLTA
jgi:hypothetical protein